MRQPKNILTGWRIGTAAALLLVVIGPAFGQSGGADSSSEKTTGGSLPELSQILDVIDRATAARPASGDEGGADWSAPVRLAVVFTILAILPSLLVMMTSFTRVVIVLAFVRRALTTQNIPPTIAIIGLALFLTLFIMAPVFGQIHQDALQPYLDGEITFPAALTRGERVLKEFMLRQTREEDLAMFVELSATPIPQTADQVPSHVAIPAFAISEFRTAFEMGALLFVPFLLIDLVVAAILLSTGMMMLPPAMVSLPFKIILFVVVDGWRLIAQTLVNSFH